MQKYLFKYFCINHLYDNKGRNFSIPSHNNPEKKPSLMHTKKKNHIKTL